MPLASPRVELWSDFQAAGGSRLAVVPDVVALGDTLRLDGADELTFVLPVRSTAASYLREQRVLRVVDLNAAGAETFDEWRIKTITEARSDGGVAGAASSRGSGGRGGPTITVKALPPLADLARALVRRVEADGTVWHDVEATQLTASQHLTHFLLAACADVGMAWVVAGTIEPTRAVDVSYRWMTALEGLRQLAAECDCELRLRRVGTTQYAIDLLEAIGSTASVVHVMLRKNLLSLARERAALELATRVYPQGADEDGLRATLARARWQVQSVNTGTGAVVLVDPAGGPGPAQFADQFDGLYLRKASGALTLISDTVVTSAAQTQLTVADATGISVGQLLELRATNTPSGGEQLTFLEAPAAKALYGIYPAVLERADLPDTVNLFTNAALTAWSAGLPTGWGNLSATVTETTTAGRWQTGGRSARVQTAGDGQGLRTPAIAITPSLARPYYSAFAALYLASGRVRVELVATDGVTTWVLPDGTNQKAFSSQTDAWIELGLAGLDLEKLGATSVYLRVVQDGATAADFYLDAVQLTDSATHRPLVDGEGPRLLWQAANIHLQRYATPQVAIDVAFADLARMYPGTFTPDELVLGGTLRARDPELGIDVTTRVIELRRNLLAAHDTHATLSNRPEDVTDRLLRPRRAPRVPRGVPTEAPLSVAAVFTPVAQSPGVVNCRLSARPAGAAIYYLVQAASVAIPVIGASAWSAYAGAFNVTPADSEDQVVAAYAELGGRTTEVQLWTIPRGGAPTVGLSISEDPAGTLRYSWTPVGDVSAVALYRKTNGAGNGWPTTDNNSTGPLDPSAFLRQMHPQADGGGIDGSGNRIAGGTSHSEAGFTAGNVVKVIAVAYDKNGVLSTRTTASRTVAGVTPALTAFSAAKLANGTSCSVGQRATARVSWTPNASVSDGTHDLLLYRALNGAPRVLVATITAPATTTQYDDELEDYAGTGPSYSWVYSYELVAGASVIASGTAAALAFAVSGYCKVLEL